MRLFRQVEWTVLSEPGQSQVKWTSQQLRSLSFTRALMHMEIMRKIDHEHNAFFFRGLKCEETRRFQRNRISDWIKTIRC